MKVLNKYFHVRKREKETQKLYLIEKFVNYK